MSAVNQSNRDILDTKERKKFNSSEMSIFPDKRVRQRICVVLVNAGVAECDFEEWIRTPLNLTTLRVNAHRTPTSKLKERLEHFLSTGLQTYRVGRGVQSRLPTLRRLALFKKR